MKKVFLVLLVLAFVLVVAAMASAASMNGWVTDSNCGLKGTSAAHEACAKKCIAAGAKVAFVPDGTKDVLIVDNPDSLKGHEGHHVAVTGSENKDAKTIHVDSVKMLAEGGEAK